MPDYSLLAIPVYTIMAIIPHAFESMPLFIAATLSGVFAEKLTRTDVGNAQFSAVFLGIRALYTILYYSHARSLTWTAGLALCFYQIYKAAVALA
ncbi:unnamed protein product [Aureobasidium pullulans]|nr:unnamed protein product [Aureobasidium pullulans]